jgi:uncharacterized protein (TIGR00730 family)
LAFTDDDFLLRDELRPVRLQLELLKPEMQLNEQGIESTVVVFGSARTLDRDTALTEVRHLESQLETQPENLKLRRELDVAIRRLDSSRYYDEARKLGRLITEDCQNGSEHPLVVVTGGGPGIMEAANRGAFETGGKSVGLNVVLPFEQAPNNFITPELTFQFHYFAIRKMHFLMRAKALVACPGGFGTLDELFETLTLIQTKKIKPMPVLLLGEDFWRQIVNFEALVDEGMISESDLELFQFVDSAEDAWKKIKTFYDLD